MLASLWPKLKQYSWCISIKTHFKNIKGSQSPPRKKRKFRFLHMAKETYCFKWECKYRQLLCLSTQRKKQNFKKIVVVEIQLCMWCQLGPIKHIYTVLCSYIVFKSMHFPSTSIYSPKSVSDSLSLSSSFSLYSTFSRPVYRVLELALAIRSRRAPLADSYIFCAAEAREDDVSPKALQPSLALPCTA